MIELEVILIIAHLKYVQPFGGLSEINFSLVSHLQNEGAVVQDTAASNSHNL